MIATQQTNTILSSFLKTRAHTLEICGPLAIEDYIPQPTADISPPKWHLGHTTWFFEQFLLVPHLKNYEIFHPDFSFLFNSYYNNMGKRVLRPERGFMTRPTVDEVRKYRQYVDDAMTQLLETIDSKEITSLLEIGINHEQQHQELLVYDIKYILGYQAIFPTYGGGYELTEEPQSQDWVQIDEGLYAIGAKGDSFFFDNEQPHHQVYLQDAALSNKLVTNGEYMQFIQDKGYENFNLWLSEGWDFINKENIKSPLYWHKKDGEWYCYSLKNGLQKVNPALPVMHLSFYEAHAFAAWAGKRLPTEFEWEAVADKLNWGQLWEWTYSAYQPYPGYKAAPSALGEYNGKFMLNQNVLRGSAIATPNLHARKTYRNFFHASSRWIFSGIRLAK